ncbi:MAG: CotH kinase family protein, partial [Bacteroidales bacterium]|nr:CotH kinase family protein [Bacteroidales bacterium]
SDWIELYNNSNNPITLLNYSLSDDSTDLSKWIFPEITISAHSFILVFASGKDRLDTNELHTNFTISSSGEELFLLNSFGIIIDQTDPVELSVDEVYGRLPDGSNNWLELFSPTPDSSNNVNNQLLFSHEGGFYTSPFYLNIISLLGDTVFYTLDGSIPTENSNINIYSLFMDYKYSSPNYFSEIPTSPGQSLISYKAWESPANIIDKASILRCASYKNGIRTSKIYTQTFFIDSIIFEKYNIPVISIVTDGENLFSYDNGIYVPGIHYDSINPEWTGNYFQQGEEWERPVHIEYYEYEGDIGFSQDAGIRIHGGKTRQAAQKSLRLYARDEYSEKYFNYQLMPQKQNNKYKRFLLRASMSAWNGQTIIADVLAHEIVRDLDVEYQDYQPVVVYINGEYWGVHTIRDRIDERYIAYTYNLNKDSVDLINGNYNLVVAGSNVHYVNLLEFIELNDLSFESNYEYVTTQMDIDNYIDYQIAEMFFANYDWPANNMKLWRPQTLNGKWRWIFYDIDAGFGNYNYNMFIHSTKNDSNITWPNSPSSTFLFRNLLKNNSFVNLFVDRYAEILNQDFDANTLVSKLNTVKKIYENEVSHHIFRWNYPDSISKWESDIEDNLLFFIENRPCGVEENIIEFFDLNEFGFSCNNNIDEIEKKNILFLAPNPSIGIFFIYNNSSEIIKGNITITSVTGKIVYVENNVSLVGNEKKYFNLTELPKNTYILNFYNTNFSEIKRIIIIK